MHTVEGRGSLHLPLHKELQQSLSLPVLSLAEESEDKAGGFTTTPTQRTKTSATALKIIVQKYSVRSITDLTSFWSKK